MIINQWTKINEHVTKRIAQRSVVHSPTVPGPTVHGPTVHGPSVHGPTVHGPTVHGPTVHGPTAHGPTVHGPTVHGLTVHGATVHRQSRACQYAAKIDPPRHMPDSLTAWRSASSPRVHTHTHSLKGAISMKLETVLGQMPSTG